jgi:hypothetical protein
MAVQVSSDGGATWGPPVIAHRAREVVGVFPVIRPDGVLVVAYLAEERIEALLSRDGGQTFTTPVIVARFQAGRVGRMRAFPLPGADVDAAGRVYVTWHACIFRAVCSGNDVTLVQSADGVTWSEPARVSSNGNAFLPAVAADGGSGRLAVAYHTLDSAGRAEVWLTTSRDAGVTWSRAHRLSAEPMPQTWIVDTTSGRMLADYISVSWVGGRTVTVYGLASEPRGGELRQAIFATQPLP